MEVKEVQNKKQKITVDVLCDICGKSCKKHEGVVGNPVRTDNGEPYYSFEYMTLKANWGYHSEHDCEEWVAQVCESCVVEKFSFVNFQKRDYI